MTDPDLTCRLPTEEVPARARQLERLAARIRSARRDGPTHAEFTFPAASEQDVHDFVRDESACCSFFGFDVATDRDTVRLTVTAPPAATSMLDAVAAGLQPGPSRAEREQGLRDRSSDDIAR